MSNKEQLYLPSLIVRDITIVDSNGRKYDPADMCEHGIVGVMLVFGSMQSALDFFPKEAIEAVDVKEVLATGTTYRM